MKQGRAYSVIDIKAVDESDGKRIIRGIASTPTPDRMDDIVLPEGAKFTLPLPLLWQHNSNQPIGHVTQAKVTKNGIEIVAEIATGVTQQIEDAWALLKAGLVRGLSIGFRGLKWSDIAGTWGVEYSEWEWLELSAVTIPANADASITSVKKFDIGAPAASPGHSVPLLSSSPGASGTIKSADGSSIVDIKNGSIRIIPPNMRPQEGNEMKTIAEQIAALEATRVAKANAMQAVMQKSIDAGRSTDEAESQEFDNLETEVASIDKDITRLRSLEKAMAGSAAPVFQAKQGAVAVIPGSRDVTEPRAAVQIKQRAPVGVRFARLAKARAIARLDGTPAAEVAEKMYGSDSEVFAIVKAAVVAGSTLTGNWAAALVGDETTAFADFVSYLRPATILGKFGVGGIPSLRNVPFREPLISQTGGGAGYWVGEGKPKPLTAFNFARTTIEPLKVANIAILTEENIRSSAPSSELIVRDALRDALIETQDLAFIDPANAGTPDVKPASVTNGATAIASTGIDADDIRLDVRAVFQAFISANNPPQSGVWIMSATNALALSLMLNPLGQAEFPGITMNGGTFMGLPVIVSQYAGSIVALVNASDIYEADDGEIAVDMSREASVEMLDGSLVQNGITGTGTSLVSLWQSNLVGLRAERTINWKRRRTSAVAYLTGVVWGGAVPTS